MKYFYKTTLSETKEIIEEGGIIGENELAALVDRFEEEINEFTTYHALSNFKRYVMMF